MLRKGCRNPLFWVLWHLGDCSVSIRGGDPAFRQGYTYGFCVPPVVPSSVETTMHNVARYLGYLRLYTPLRLYPV